MSHSITRVDHGTSEITLAHGARFGARYLCIKCESRLDTNEQTFNVECLEHNLCHLFSILRSIKRRLSQNESVLFRLTPKLRVNSAMPELFHGLPVLNLSTTNDILQVVGFLVQECVITNVVV